jgi:hypothetical protein
MMWRILRSVVVALVMAAMIMAMAMPALAEPPFFFRPGETPPPPANTTSYAIVCKEGEVFTFFGAASHPVGGHFGFVNRGAASAGVHAGSGGCEKFVIHER